MVRLETLSTDEVAARRRVEYWNQVSCETFMPLSADPVDPPVFSGSIKRTRIGGMLMAEVQADALTSYRSPLHVAQTREHMYFIHLQLSGNSINQQSGREARLTPGDFTLTDNARPSRKTLLGNGNQRLMFGITHAALKRRLPHPENVLGLSVKGNSGLGALTSNFLMDFWKRCTTELDETAALRVTDTVLDLIAGSLGMIAQAQPEGSSLAAAHRLRIAKHIEANLCDPNLTPARIAEACRITPRYLHYLFADQEETVGKYILRRRLERCASLLASASQQGRTVTAIAFDHGFVNLTHFGKAFREHYGMTPSEYRRTHTNVP